MFQFYCKCIRFQPNGKQLWVISQKGNVILFLTTDKKIEIGETRCINLVCHSDAVAEGSVHFTSIRPTVTAQLVEDGAIEIPAAVLCFYPGGNTVWVHAENGSTILRLRASQGLDIDEAIHGLDEEDDTFFAHFHILNSVDICLVEEISKKFGLLQ